MIRPASAADLRYLAGHAAEDGLRPYLDDTVLAAVAASSHASVLCSGDEPIAAGGLIECGESSALAWAVIGRVQRHHVRSMCEAFRAALALAPFKYIEAHVQDDFRKSERWLAHLGFERLGQSFALMGKTFHRFAWTGNHLPTSKGALRDSARK